MLEPTESRSYSDELVLTKARLFLAAEFVEAIAVEFAELIAEITIPKQCSNGTKPMRQKLQEQWIQTKVLQKCLKTKHALERRM
jgi:hypothetical protein